MIEALERHTNVSYTKDEKTVDRALRSAWFEDLTEIADAYESRVSVRVARLVVGVRLFLGQHVCNACGAADLASGS